MLHISTILKKFSPDDRDLKQESLFYWNWFKWHHWCGLCCLYVDIHIFVYTYIYACMCKANFKHPYGSVPSKVYRWTWSAAHLTAGSQHCLVRTYLPSCFAWEMNSYRKPTVWKAKEIEGIFFFPPHNADVRWVQVWNMFSGVHSTVFLNSLNSVLGT